ncbi:beta-lactamase [Emticicia oligotrophica DSM 17448]|uniref:Beta-lactamase n=1 Tax=Emticicia oligotrophica (strain DSM 17448 / CIP 109782 / MTCC 6937 / GPTSA100-15) TaxID=929562 RepID=A0ABM5MZY4_EMTOG|nr:serine hydrolase [Emticicia oligotrophica]AFK02742.1 beta-lactamase [Emticicia oligotrophica DSM 17448]
MSNKRKIIYATLLIVAIGLIYAGNYAIQYAYIGSSYNAKTVCSCMFVSGRDLENIKAEELYAVPFATVEVDEVNKAVTANIYGLAQTKAIYRKGLGCTLVNELTEEEIKKQPSVPLADTLTEKLTTISDFAGIDKVSLDKTINDAFQEKDPQNIIRTRAVVVLHNGQILAERYATNIKPETPLLGWSMTKSVTSAMIGLLVKDGKLDIKKPAPISEWQNDERKKITIDHLLRMSSGLGFEENYAAPSDATRMLFRKKGAGAYALQSKAAAEPDKIWSYSSGTSNILQEIIRRQFASHANYLAFPYQRLFHKIGMKSAVLEPDAIGTFVGSSFMYATARDWAKFGQLYLQDGIWNGERLLPEGWVKYSSTETAHSDGKYAAHFWLDHQDITFPQDAFMALGFEGQSVTVVPSKNLVIVRLGCTPKDNFNLSALVKGVVAAVK